MRRRLQFNLSSLMWAVTFAAIFFAVAVPLGNWARIEWQEANERARFDTFDYGLPRDSSISVDSRSIVIVAASFAAFGVIVAAIRRFNLQDRREP